MRDLEGLSPSIEKKFPKLHRILKLDDTNRQSYIMGKFTCNEFSMRLYFQRSERGYPQAYDLPGFEIDSGVPFQTDGSTEKLPLFYVNMTHIPAGFYHAINAMLINPERPDVPESYIFIEPQTDEVMLSLKEVYDHYARYYGHINSPLEVNISDIASYKFNGKIYQSFSSPLYRFQVSR